MLRKFKLPFALLTEFASNLCFQIAIDDFVVFGPPGDLSCGRPKGQSTGTGADGRSRHSSVWMSPQGSMLLNCVYAILIYLSNFSVSLL